MLVSLVFKGKLSIEYAVSKLLKPIVWAWNSDFTKVTSEEKEKIKIAEKEFQEGIYFTDEDVWN